MMTSPTKCATIGHVDGEDMIMAESRIWRACAIFALLTVAILFSFGLMPGMAECGGSDAIIKFEFARSSTDILDQIKTPGCAQGQYYGLWWDAMLFIPTYATFLILTLLGLRPHGPQLVRMGIAMVIIAALSDQVEGTRLFAILGDMPGRPEYFAVLHWAVRIKFALLAVATLVVAALLARRGKMHWLAAVLIAGGSVATLYGLAGPQLKLVSLGGFLSWLPLIITAQFIAWRRSPSFS